MLERIGKYRVLDRIGHGSSSTVYRAYDDFLGKEVAIKVYTPETPGTMPAKLRAQFLNEASLVGRLSHPHITELLDADADDELTYLVCEYVGGGNLLSVTQSGKPVDLVDVIEIGFKCCGALDFAYRNNIIHRDLKPANILLAGGTNVKISDFGIAYIRNAESTQIMTAGSPAYASPEQVKGKELSHHSDMFSLAVVLYELATGRRPFAGSDSGETINQILHQSPPAPSTRNPRAFSHALGR